MPAGELYINNKDAYKTWGISLEDGTSLSALMTPVPNKAYIQNKSRLEHGKRVIVNNPKKDERIVTLPIKLVARDESDFFTKYGSFCDELALGTLVIRTKYQPTVYYKCVYISCTQFSQFMRGIAKYTLRLEEPDPNDRSNA